MGLPTTAAMATAEANPVHLIPTPRKLTMIRGELRLPALLETGPRVAAINGVPRAILDSVFFPQNSPLVQIAPNAPVRACEASGLPAQGYRLRIDESGVLLEHGDGAGLRYALVTLKHLIARHWQPQHNECALPHMLIEDFPAFTVRGVMLDVSRDRVPTMQELHRIVRTLADLKINHLQLYTEHTFAYAGHEKAWQGWSPLTGAEVRQLDQWCQELGIELAANQNCFGHLAHWLRMPEYSHLAETHGDWIFEVWPRSGPFSLCPTDPKSLEFVRDLLTQLTANFTSPLVNIGADETYDIAFGRSAEIVAKRGRAAVYLEFVKKICEVTTSLGKRPMFWADIALHEPGCIKDIPPELLSLAWGYEPHSPFEQWTKLLRDAGRDVWVCPGTSSWRSITGRSAERNGNLNAAGACAIGPGNLGANGYLICDWGDTGHHQQWPVVLHAIAHGAQAAWTGSTNGSLAADISTQLYGLAGSAVGPWLEALGDADIELRKVAGRLSRPNNEGEFALWNQSALFADLHNCVWGDRVEVGTVPQWHAAAANLSIAHNTIPAGLPLMLADELAHTLAMAQLAADRALARREHRSDSAIKSELSERIRRLMVEHTRLWPMRSRPGGLDHSNTFWQKLLDGMVQS